MPPADLGFVGLVALVPILWAVRGARPRRGALVGFVFGTLYFLLQMSWLGPLTKLGWITLGISVGGWMALLFAFVVAVWREKAPVRTALAFASAWTFVEWLRASWPFEGFTWAGLGYTQAGTPMLRLASVVGVWGIAFLVAAINVLLLSAVLRRNVRQAAMITVLLVAPTLVPFPVADGRPVDVAVVQGNVPEDLAAASRILADRIVAADHARLHRGLASDQPDLVVWPENALDLDPTLDPSLRDLVTGAVRAVGSPTLIGAITERPDGRLFNEDLFYAPDGTLAGRYAKRHLLAFGEYVPARRLLSWIPDISQVRDDLTPGTRFGHFRIPQGRFATIICFENVFPDEVRRAVEADDAFLVVSTNNSSFLRSPAGDQHLMHSRLRAVETGRWIVHGALSGITAFVSPAGEVSHRTRLFEAAVARGTIRAASGRTIYGRFGGWIPWLLLLGTVAAWAAPRRAKRRHMTPPPDPARIAVVLPTYNERDTIEEVVRGVLAAGADAIVVDDASPDGTAGVVAAIADETPRVTLLGRPGKRGLASAYHDGFRLALERGYDVLVEMDSDLSHRPVDLPAVIEGARRFDVTIGSRYVRGGAVRNWGLGRRLLSRFGNAYARLLLGHPVRDATGGFRAFRAEAIRALLAGGITSEGYGFQVELAYRAWRMGFAVGEVPIIFEERRAGASKMSRGIVVEALWRVLLWGIRDRVLRRRPPRLA